MSGRRGLRLYRESLMWTLEIRGDQIDQKQDKCWAPPQNKERCLVTNLGQWENLMSRPTNSSRVWELRIQGESKSEILLVARSWRDEVCFFFCVRHYRSAVRSGIYPVWCNWPLPLVFLRSVPTTWNGLLQKNTKKARKQESSPTLLTFSNEVGRGFSSFDWRKVDRDLMLKANISSDVTIHSGTCRLICK